MKIEDPSIHFEKKLRVFSADGEVIDCELDGYDYDYDDNCNEFLEFDVELETGMLIGLTEDEIEKIEIIE